MSFSKGTPGTPMPMQQWADMHGQQQGQQQGQHPHQWPGGQGSGWWQAHQNQYPPTGGPTPPPADQGNPLPPPMPQTPPGAPSPLVQAIMAGMTPHGTLPAPPDYPQGR